MTHEELAAMDVHQLQNHAAQFDGLQAERDKLKEAVANLTTRAEAAEKAAGQSAFDAAQAEQRAQAAETRAASVQAHLLVVATHAFAHPEVKAAQVAQAKAKLEAASAELTAVQT